MRTRSRRREVETRPEPAQFLNVDVDVYSRRRLRTLTEALGGRILLLYEGREGSRYGAHWELAGAFGKGPDYLIRHLASLIEGLPTAARRHWDDAQSRAFNIGVQAGLEPRAHELAVSPDTLARVATLRARVVVTTYRPVVRDVGRSAPRR